jgi:hypothetical protein
VIDKRLTDEQGDPDVSVVGRKRRVAVAEEEGAKVISLVVVNEHIEDGIGLLIQVVDPLAIGVVGVSGAAL